MASRFCARSARLHRCNGAKLGVSGLVAHRDAACLCKQHLWMWVIWAHYSSSNQEVKMMRLPYLLGRILGFQSPFGSRKDLRHLLELDDYLLDDMGLTRSALTAEWYRIGKRVKTSSILVPPGKAIQKESPSHFVSVALMSIVILAWGINWSVGKAVLDYLPPVWAAALRTIPACLAVWVLSALAGQAKVPAKSDIPVIFNVGLLHMAAFTVLATIGLQYVPAGKSAVLAYTTPLWVLPAAWLFLHETLSRQRMLGMAIGLAGLALLLQPSVLDWHDPDILYGHVLILGAALCWAICIVYNRAHKSTTSTLQLLPWQILLAAVVQLALAVMLEGVPAIEWSWRLLGLLAYGSLIGTVLAYWAMNSVSRRLSASVVSLASLGVPVLGLFSSALILGEALSAQLLFGTALIVGGVALAMLSRRVKQH